MRSKENIINELNNQINLNYNSFKPLIDLVQVEMLIDIRDQLEQIQKALWAIRAVETVAVNKIK